MIELTVWGAAPRESVAGPSTRGGGSAGGGGQSFKVQKYVRNLQEKKKKKKKNSAGTETENWVQGKRTRRRQNFRRAGGQRVGEKNKKGELCKKDRT